MRYRLEITRKQAQVIQEACDLYSRLKCGQMEELLRFFDLRARASRDDFQAARVFLEKIGQIVTGLGPGVSHSVGSHEIGDEARVAYDLLQVIRNRLAWEEKPEGGLAVDFDEVRHGSQEPIPLFGRLPDGTDLYRIVHPDQHTKECLAYAEQTGQPFCIAECFDARLAPAPARKR